MKPNRKTVAKASDLDLCDELIRRGWNVSLKRPKWWLDEQRKKSSNTGASR